MDVSDADAAATGNLSVQVIGPRLFPLDRVVASLGSDLSLIHFVL